MKLTELAHDDESYDTVYSVISDDHEDLWSGDHTTLSLHLVLVGPNPSCTGIRRSFVSCPLADFVAENLPYGELGSRICSSFVAFVVLLYHHSTLLSSLSVIAEL